jgi:hypothetical protein
MSKGDNMEQDNGDVGGELLPARHEIKWVPGQHYAIQLDAHYDRLHEAYARLLADNQRLREAAGAGGE